MSYISSSFSDTDYYDTGWTSDTFDLTTMNPNAYGDMEYSLYWEEDRITNGDYIEVRIDVVDSSGSVIIPDIKRYDNGDQSTFTLSGYTEMKLVIKVYQHKSFNTDIKISNLAFDNKIWFITNEGEQLLLDVMAYDTPTYSSVNSIRLGDEQSFWNKSFTASDFEPKLIGTENPIYDNADVVWEDLYNSVPFTADTTAALDSSNNIIYVFSDSTSFSKFDIDSNTWSVLSVYSGSPVAAEYYNGNVYYITNDSGDNKIWVYNISADTHTLKQTISSNVRSDGDSVLYNGKIYFMGGSEGLNNMLVYDIVSDSTSTIASTVTSDLTGGRCALSSDKIYFMGGNSSFLYIYDITNSSWSQGTDMPTSKNYFGCVNTKNKYLTGSDIIYTFQGSNSSHTSMNIVEAYDISTDTWTVKHDSPFNNNNAYTVSDSFYTWIIGGLLNKIWRYEPEPVSCVVGGHAYGQISYGSGSYSDLQDRCRIGTCRIGDVSSSGELYTSYIEFGNSLLDDNKINFLGFLSNNGSEEVIIDSLGFFNDDATRKLFSYVKLKFPFNTTDDYRISGSFRIVPVSSTKTVVNKDATNGFLERVFNGPYVSDYTYITKFLAGEETGYFTEITNSMTAEHYGPVDFKTVTINTGTNSFIGTGNIDTASGNGHDYDAFAMLCEEPGVKTLVDDLSFTNGIKPFDNTGEATVSVSSVSTGILGVTYSIPVDINSISVHLEGLSFTQGTVDLITYDGSSWGVEEPLSDGLLGYYYCKRKFYIDKEVYGVGIQFTDIKGNIIVKDIYHAGNKRQMAFATKINHPISKTSDYNLLIDMKEELQ